MAGADNTQVAQQLAALYEKMNDLLESQNTHMKDQVTLMKSLVDAAGQKPANGGLTDYLSDLGDLMDELGITSETTGQKVNKSLEEGNKTALELSKSIHGFGDFLDTLWKTTKKGFVKGFEAGLTSIKDSFSSIVDIGWSVFDLFGQMTESIYKIGTAIFSIPMQIFSGMIKLAGALAEAYKHIAQAFEKFRGEFGATYNLQGKALREGLKDARSMSKLAGLGYFSVFQDSAEAIAFFQESFTKLGPLVDSFAKEIGAMGGKFVHFVKGMGLSGEQVKTLAMIAKGSGKTLENVLGEVANMTLQMAETFGISNKQLAQDVTSMMGDVKTFGNTSVKSLSATAVRVRSLGIEVKSLAGIVDKFLNFEDAAKSASMLSQSFGVNLDALGLMNAAGKDQGKLLDDLRNSMFAAGKDATKMSTAELRLLAQTTGLSEEEAKLAFSMSNRGKSLEDIKKQSEKAKHSELSQAQAMAKLADAIERIIRVFSYDSFFGAFIQGFTLGVKHAAPFMKTLFSLQAALDQTRIAGQQVGAAFVKTFPGVMDMLKALQGTFNPEIFSKFREKIVDAFTGLFKDLNTMNPTMVMKRFWTKLWGSFDVVTDQESGDMYPKIQAAFKIMLTAFGNIISGTIPLIGDKLVDAMDFLSQGLIDGFDVQIKKLTGESDSVAKDLWTTFFGPIWKALERVWESPKFQNSLYKLKEVLKVKIVNGLEDIGIWIKDHPEVVLGVIVGLTALIGGAAVVAAIGTFVSVLAGAIGAGLMSLGAFLSPWILLATAGLTAIFVAFTIMGGEAAAVIIGTVAAAYIQFKSLQSKFNAATTALSTGFDYVKTIATTKISEITGAITAGFTQGIMPIGTAMIDPFSKGFDAVKTLFGIHSPSKMFKDEIGGPIASGLIKGMSENLVKMPDILTKSLGGTDIIDSIIGDAQSTLQGVVAKIADINSSISDIPDLDIQMKLEKIGKVLGIKDNKLQINASPVNITLNLSVTLEADTLATVLLDTKKIMPQGG